MQRCAVCCVVATVCLGDTGLHAGSHCPVHDDDDDDDDDDDADDAADDDDAVDDHHHDDAVCRR